MIIKLELELKEKVEKNIIEGKIIKILFDNVKTLKKSIHGQVLRIFNKSGKIIKLMEKRATRSYRIYYIHIINDNICIIIDIGKKKFQKRQIEYIMENFNRIIENNHKLFFLICIFKNFSASGSLL
jgi:hypothetical protein